MTDTDRIDRVVQNGVVQKSVSGATSAAPKAIYNISAPSTLCAYPTAAGTATCYVSTSALADCIADVTANNFATGAAKWRTIPALTAITAETDTAQPSPVTAVAILPASGTWALEAVQ